ncbi:MAG: hypothetical protein JEZ14_00095 [Marinilabiliaceae bacterium]|nr:hypothetical protein [Marinilabiliaceae bacterium]
MWQILLITIVLMAAIFALFSIKILLQKNGKFPNSHVGGNKALAKKGIYCATTQDKMERKRVIRVPHLDLGDDYESTTTSC